MVSKAASRWIDNDPFVASQTTEMKVQIVVGANDEDVKKKVPPEASGKEPTISQVPKPWVATATFNPIDGSSITVVEKAVFGRKFDAKSTANSIVQDAAKA